MMHVSKQILGVVLLVGLVACGKFKGPKGEDGADGEQGPTGMQGPVGPVGPQGEAGQDGADGADGQDGADGVDGQDGADGQDASLEIIHLCDTESGEVLVRLPDGRLMAHYASGINQYFVILEPGNYVTTDGNSCDFTVDAEGTVEDELGNIWSI